MAFFPKNVHIFRQVLSGRAAELILFSYSVYFSPFFSFFKRSEKVFFWALRTKTPAEKVLARMLVHRTGTLHHSANAAPSFLISSNLWFKGLQAILAIHTKESAGGERVNLANFTVCDHRANDAWTKIYHVWNFAFIQGCFFFFVCLV